MAIIDMEHLQIHNKWLFFRNLIRLYFTCHSYIIAIQKAWKIDQWRMDYDADHDRDAADE